MRWSIIRLIWFREFRDLLRDRRTLFLVLVLPMLLYPGIGAAGLAISWAMAERPSVIGVVGNPPHFPARGPMTVSAADSGLSPLPAATWMALAPQASLDRALGTLVLARVSHHCWDYPQLVVSGRLAAPYLVAANDVERLRFRFLEQDPQQALLSRQVDLAMTVPVDFWTQLERGGRVRLELVGRPNDERSRLLRKRLYPVLEKWQNALKETRLRRAGLPGDYDLPLTISDADQRKAPLERATDELFQMLVKVLPFLIVMWSLAGALYPAVDVGAGEKERGTLETLLVSPATRMEIVYGKFLAVWVASTATTLWNLLGVAGSFFLVRLFLPLDVLRPTGLIGSAIMVLPLAALFSAVCLPVGVYARSTKEGQYYLMPLLLGTVVLVFWALAPDMELNWWSSLVPVTGAVLLQQRLMTAISLGQVPWRFLLPVLVGLLLWIWLALRWAVRRFQQEEVLFRESQRKSLGNWLYRLLHRR